MRVLGVFGEQRAFIAVALTYIAIGAVASVAGQPMRFGLYHPGMLLAVSVVFCLFLLSRIVVLMMTPGKGRPTVRLYRDLASQNMLERILRPIPVLLLAPSILSIYTSWKVMIPDIVPMDWDPTLAAMDRAIHGDDAWRLVGAVLGNPAGGLAMAVIYAGWFWVFQIVLVWQALCKTATRQQFLISWVLVWGVVGTIGALLFASVGPVFYGRLHGQPDPFHDLYVYVHSLPSWIAVPQDALWDAFANGSLFWFGKGISAMPSLHVAIATLNAMAAWRTSRPIGAALGVYAGLVAVASVGLGWHYAVDAYAGAATAAAVWFAVGRVLAMRTSHRSASATATAE
jgi:hypothetical protein